MRLKHRRLAHFRIRAKCGLCTLVSFASAALAFFWAGCGEGGSRTAKSNGIRELNELPIGQMRVML
ncbi:MAG TPA: hypothetical protein VFG14_07815, partial [Chthoniobacteraceae bacterium]|nr:hypothetical protein [Chthoniobacteraceae bacterium]